MYTIWVKNMVKLVACLVKQNLYFHQRNWSHLDKINRCAQEVSFLVHCII